ncbi:MAG TPA: nuclear transport factor 2 family protein [Pseudomonadales bacterium]|nr:nuclear transport factor 2 family protein [Pseudomonadales bacterium]
MTMDIREISDRLEINNLLIDYCSAVDAKDFDQFDHLFTADALIVYTALGGARGSVAEIKDYLKRVMPYFPATQHMIANSRVWVDGDTAHARTMCHNPMEIPLPAGGTQIAFYGLWYVDRLVRTAQGWRIAERVEERGYAYNVPAHFTPSDK